MTIRHQTWLADALLGSVMLFALYLILLAFSNARLPQALHPATATMLIPVVWHGGFTVASAGNGVGEPFSRRYSSWAYLAPAEGRPRRLTPFGSLILKGFGECAAAIFIGGHEGETGA